MRAACGACTASLSLGARGPRVTWRSDVAASEPELRLSACGCAGAADRGGGVQAASHRGHPRALRLLLLLIPLPAVRGSQACIVMRAQARRRVPSPAAGVTRTRTQWLIRGPRQARSDLDWDSGAACVASGASA
eukprot:269220-Rhodomonas_salina.3